MRFGRLPARPLDGILDLEATEYTVYRPTDVDTGEATSDGWGESRTQLSGSGFTTITGVSLALSDPDLSEVTDATGTRVSGTVTGACDTNVDIEEDDVIQYGSHYYELDAKNAVPSEDDPSHYELRFRTRHDVVP